MATLRAVALAAGVSTSTVSHVVNGTRRVEPVTEARVLRAIETTGYQVNRIARALRRSATESVGLIISDVENPYFWDVVRGVELEARAAGFTVLLANSDDNPAREKEAVTLFRGRQVDGLMLVPTSGTSQRIISEIASLDVPVVLIDRVTDLPVDQVGVENEASMRQLAEHLIAIGHTRIGFVSGLSGISTSDERLRGYKLALEGAGIAFDASLVGRGRSRHGTGNLCGDSHAPTQAAAVSHHWCKQSDDLGRPAGCG